MLRILLLLLLASLYSYQGPDARSTEPPAPYEDLEAYQVYSAILPLEWPSTVAKAKTLVITAETAQYKMCLRPDEESRKIIGAAIEDYLRLTKQSWSSSDVFHPIRPTNWSTSPI